ncbi:Maf family protein [Thermoanaerobacterium thermosaccharolyticum]|jgi:septum formation protein|uniref:dTTP/UTP pyrophosphatase n=1 Tax=Thermoanaerobacterium thermosaccharolyticum TaxID=1517 RepID=A0A223HV99_THETR|nr:Maf family protein [Thermoanaerobacterium thermosaccharolyticum]AST56386.1 Maf-like protein [Thermoanaerobacterium thermosaccharolyticum]MCP2239722.1 septum formation protein [Thermoanaerobacterium thermosaccharolyticum]PHO08411.1 septum formation protein Maf [Thermoanaerobacterium thermosaccharolyticum]
MKIVLASNSPRRREILSNIGLDFDVIPSNIAEETKEEEPENIVMDLSRKKALCVAEKLDDDSIVIGADTVVVIDGEILGKPKDKGEAFSMLRKLSGRWHKVYTGVSVVSLRNRKLINDYESTDVYIKNLSDDMILNYIEKGECLDKAGSYAIQGYGSLIVERINGDYFNVVGLPISKLYDIFLNEFNINLL